MNILKKTPIVFVLILALVLGGCRASAPATQTDGGVVYRMDTMPAEPRQEETIRRLTQPRLYDISDGAVVSGIAQLPVDVTADYRGSYGIPGDANRGYAFQIALDELCRSDGRALTARAFSEAMEIENYPWIAGVTELLEGWERESENVISLKEAGFSGVADAQAAGYHRFYVNCEEFWGLDTGWISTSARERIRDYAMLSGVSELFVTGGYLYRYYLEDGMDYDHWQADYVGVTAQPEARMTMEDVGILVTEDDCLIIITAEPATSSLVAARLMDLIPAGDGDFGPYYVASVTDEAIVLEENPYWTGTRPDYPRIECRMD